MKLGLLVSMVISIVFFGEVPGFMQLLGFLLAVAAIVLMNYKSGEGRFNMGLLLILFIGGMCDGMSKVYEEIGDAALSGQFLFYTFFTALLLCLVMGRGKIPSAREIAYGAAIGVPNFFSSQFMLQALATVPGVIAYPVYSVAGILLVTLAGVVFFRERLQKRQWTALGIILIALILLNL
jgi:multidrug transporter EmrE-like cation transporter